MAIYLHAPYAIGVAKTITYVRRKALLLKFIKLLFGGLQPPYVLRAANLETGLAVLG